MYVNVLGSFMAELYVRDSAVKRYDRVTIADDRDEPWRMSL